MVIATVVVGGEGPLGIDGAAEFAAPDHHGLLQQAAPLQIDQQRGGRLVGILALRAQIARQVPVLVPSAVQDLHDAHAPFHEPPGQQRAGRIRAGLG
jgi:hypothetical protein